ncbi:MAG: 30S ribosome-binding factor RbfA [Pseudomonadota bacterium]
MDREYGRHDRVAALLRRELALLIQRQVKDPRVRDVTVTDVEVTGDLSLAKVYVASADEKTLPESVAGLKRAAGYLRRELGQRLTLRMVPELRFLGDDSAQRGDHIESLLKSVLPADAPEEGSEPEDDTLGADGEETGDEPGTKRDS